MIPLSPNSPSRSEIPKIRIACRACTHAGRPCRARALPGRLFCHFHDPDRAAALAASRSKGGAAPRRRCRRQVTPVQVSHALGEFLLRTLRHPGTADTDQLRRLDTMARLWFQSHQRLSLPGPGDIPSTEASGQRIGARLTGEIEAALAAGSWVEEEPRHSTLPVSTEHDLNTT